MSGKLRAQRAKSMKFKDGYMISSGQPVNEYIDSAVRHVLLRQVWPYSFSTAVDFFFRFITFFLLANKVRPLSLSHTHTLPYLLADLVILSAFCVKFFYLKLGYRSFFADSPLSSYCLHHSWLPIYILDFIILIMMFVALISLLY